MKRLAVFALAAAFVVFAATPAQAAVAGSATATTACADGHVWLTVTAQLPASTYYVKYTAGPVGTFDLGSSTPGGVWTVHVTRRSGRTAESYNLYAKYAAIECAP